MTTESNDINNNIKGGLRMPFSKKTKDSESNTKKGESRLAGIIRWFDTQMEKQLWLLSRYIFNPKNLRNIVKFFPRPLSIINLIFAFPIIIVGALDFYFGAIMFWSDEPFSILAWLESKMPGGLFRKIVYTFIGINKFIISIIMVIACGAIFFQTYNLNKKYIQTNGFEFLVIITQVFFLLMPYIFLTLSLIISIGILKAYYKKFCENDMSELPEDSAYRNPLDKMLHEAATMNVAIMFILSIGFPILLIAAQRLQWLKRHIPSGLNLYDNVKLIFIGLLSFIIFTAATDTISDFVYNLYYIQLVDKQEFSRFCSEHDPRKNINKKDPFSIIITTIKSVLTGLLFVPMCIAIVCIQSLFFVTICNTAYYEMFNRSKTIVDLVLKFLFDSSSFNSEKYKGKTLTQILNQAELDKIDSDKEEIKETDKKRKAAKEQFDRVQREIQNLYEEYIKKDVADPWAATKKDKTYKGLEEQRKKHYYDSGYGVRNGFAYYIKDTKDGKVFLNSEALDKHFKHDINKDANIKNLMDDKEEEIKRQEEKITKRIKNIENQKQIDEDYLATHNLTEKQKTNIENKAELKNKKQEQYKKELENLTGENINKTVDIDRLAEIEKVADSRYTDAEKRLELANKAATRAAARAAAATRVKEMNMDSMMARRAVKSAARTARKESAAIAASEKAEKARMEVEESVGAASRAVDVARAAKTEAVSDAEKKRVWLEGKKKENQRALALRKRMEARRPGSI